MKFEENRDTYSKIASLYYIADMPQREIADMFGISRFRVSRILKKCRTMKIVEFKINSSPGYFSDIEKEIKERLSVSGVMIVQSGSTLYESKKNVARMAAKYLEETIKDDMKIGLSWGSTIQQVVRYYNKKDSFPKTIFIQLSGSLCQRSLHEDGYMEGDVFVQQFAKKLQADWSVFAVPYIVQNPLLKEMLYTEPQIEKHVSLFKQLDMALIGIGAEDSAGSVSYLSGYLSYEETKKLHDEGMAADICGTRLTIDGEIRETVLTDRVLTVDLKDLYRTRDVCAIGAGAEKALSFIAGCRGGFIKTVIMDEICALSIINRL